MVKFNKACEAHELRSGGMPPPQKIVIYKVSQIDSGANIPRSSECIDTCTGLMPHQSCTMRTLATKGHSHLSARPSCDG